MQWLSLIKLFELEVSIRKMAQQMGLAYRTIYQAVQTIRLAIVSQAQDAALLLGGEFELDESYFGGRRILERDGQVHVRLFADVTEATLLKMMFKSSAGARSSIPTS